MDYRIEKCKCGADGRLRKSGGTAWVECRKKCGRTSGYFRSPLDEDNQLFLKSMDNCVKLAIDRWNRLVKKDG